MGIETVRRMLCVGMWVCVGAWGARGDLIVHGGTTIDMAFVPVPAVGGVANAADIHGAGYGSVGHDYRIGTYEVTAGQYTAFLNAAAASDPNGLYNPSMDSNPNGCQITRVSSSGSYIYDFSGAPSGTASDWESRPVNYVSWYDAARFCNWLTTGDTETGVYVFSGGVLQSIADRTLAAISYGTVYIIPTEDEWYKAAYYAPALNGGLGGYYDYPTGSDSLPGRDMTETTNLGNNANFESGGYLLDSPYYRTNVGEFELSASLFGTFDQGGNVWEWNETPIGDNRGLRGGSFDDTGGSNLHAGGRGSAPPTLESIPSIGFRVASFSLTVIPEPGSLWLLSVALAGMVVRRRRS
jgi:formylglycine-generating enzyme